jgi:hypothetical protein
MKPGKHSIGEPAGGLYGGMIEGKGVKIAGNAAAEIGTVISPAVPDKTTAGEIPAGVPRQLQGTAPEVTPEQQKLTSPDLLRTSLPDWNSPPPASKIKHCAAGMITSPSTRQKICSNNYTENGGYQS